MKTLQAKNSFLHLTKEYSTVDNSKIALLLIQWAGESKLSETVIKKIISASHSLEIYDEEQGKELAHDKGIATFQPLVLKGSFENKTAKITQALLFPIQKEKFIASISDNQCASFGLIKSHSEKFKNLSVLHLGSRAELKNYSESKNHNCSLMNQISEFSSNIVQVGIRSFSKSENEIRKERKIKQFLASEIKLGMYGNEWQELVSKNLTENVYITLDPSVFDPSIIPNVENPDPGGLNWEEILYLLKIIGQEKKIVGFDVSGLKSNKNFQHTYYYIAKLVYKILNYAL